MADVDPGTLLEWLLMDQSDEREMQLIALEQLCMVLLMSDNVDRCFERQEKKKPHILQILNFDFFSRSCPPRTFLPALCKVFLDERAPYNVLEVTARAITYYLDVSGECARRVVGVDGAIKAFCARLEAADMTTRVSRDLAEQCIKAGSDPPPHGEIEIEEYSSLGSRIGFVSRRVRRVRVGRTRRDSALRSRQRHVNSPRHAPLGDERRQSAVRSSRTDG